MRIRIDIEGEDLRRLVSIAFRELRPIPMQAEYMLIKALREAMPVVEDHNECKGVGNDDTGETPREKANE